MSEIFSEFIDFITKNGEKLEDYPDKDCAAYRFKNYYVLFDLLAGEPEDAVICVAKKENKEPKVLYIKPTVYYVKEQASLISKLKRKFKHKFKKEQTNPQILKKLLDEFQRET